MNLSKFNIVNLEPHFNADAISYDRNRFDGAFGLSSYPAEELPESNSIVYVSNIPFKFPSKEDAINNNIECYNHSITIPEGHYNSIYFLGACDNGSFEEKILLVFNEKQIIEKLSFTNWISDTPIFGEKMAFQCSHLHVQGKDAFLYKPAIWMQKIKLNEAYLLREIHLPDNPSLHIFSITLERSSHDVSSIRIRKAPK